MDIESFKVALRLLLIEDSCKLAEPLVPGCLRIVFSVPCDLAFRLAGIRYPNQPLLQMVAQNVNG